MSGPNPRPLTPYQRAHQLWLTALAWWQAAVLAPMLPRMRAGRQRATILWHRMATGFSRWWNGGVWNKVALIAAVPFLCICMCCSTALVFAETPYGQQLARETEATETASTVASAQAAASATQYAFLHPAPTGIPSPTPLPTETAAPTPTDTPVPTDTAVPTNTAVPPPPLTDTPVPPCTTPYCNPWGYDFNPGNLVYSPPGNFCDYFPCIASFWQHTNGYVEECQDGDFSHSGGVQGYVSREVWALGDSHRR